VRPPKSSTHVSQRPHTVDATINHRISIDRGPAPYTPRFRPRQQPCHLDGSCPIQHRIQHAMLILLCEFRLRALLDVPVCKLYAILSLNVPALPHSPVNMDRCRLSLSFDEQISPETASASPSPAGRSVLSSLPSMQPTPPRESLGVGSTAVHINHQLRAKNPTPTSDSSKTFASASTSPSIFTTPTSHPHRANPSRWKSRNHRRSRRNARYEFFTTLLASGHADSILTGPHSRRPGRDCPHKLLRGA